jgi:hypothetical protein
VRLERQAFQDPAVELADELWRQSLESPGLILPDLVCDPDDLSPRGPILLRCWELQVPGCAGNLSSVSVCLDGSRGENALGEEQLVEVLMQRWLERDAR